MKKNILLSLLLSGIVLAATAQGYVGVKSGINLREYGDAQSSVLAVIPYGTQIEPLVKESYGSATMDGMKGDWRKVSWNGKTGYVFDGFLLPQTAPESNLGIDDYFAKMYPKQGEAVSWSSENGEQYTQTIHDKGAFIITAKSKGYISAQYYLTGLNLQKAFLLCKLFTPFAELIGETENFPMSDMDRNGRVVKQLYSPNPAIKNVIGIYILDKNSTFRIRENEGRIEITYSRTEA